MAIRIGNNRANVINGTSRSDIIFGLAGDDIINAGAGNDLVFAGAGNDQIFAGDGNDWVFAGLGNDVVSGGAGNDFLYGEAGNDVLDGGLGSDIVDGGVGNDTLIFTDAERGGLDRYIGGAGQDSLVLEFAAARWANSAVKAEVRAYLDFIAAGGTGNFTFTTMNLIVSSVEALVVKVDGVIIDPRAGGNTLPTGVADSYSTGENGILTVSPATERGTLVDNDNTGNGAFTVELVAGPARGALTLNANGTFSFNPATAFDYLAAGQSAVETFTYRIVNSAGASAPVTVSLNIAGANDAATIGGAKSGAVTEDGGTNTAAGAVTITDADAGQAALANPGTLQGTYGTLVLAADGAWTYTLNNSLAATQALGAGDAATETFAISSADGTAASAVTVTVNGVNDAAVFTGGLTGVAVEDNLSTLTESLVLTTSGQVTVTDVDSGESGIGNAGTFAGDYGSLNLQADGNWVYTLDNNLTDVQALGAGDQAHDVFAVTALDGTQAFIDVTVQGTDDDAVIGGTMSDIIVLQFEDSSAQGFITVADVDTGEAGVTAGTANGLYGTLTMEADGNWSYLLTDFGLPFDEGINQVNDVFTLYTLGGDEFSINVIIQQDGFIIG
jgi:VCBS repeat-containing protein